MTELYRGLLLVLTGKFNELILAFRTHIQFFKQATNDPDNYFDVDVLGFWNLMLEISMTFFAIVCLLTGLTLIAILAITFYPCHAFLRYSSLFLKTIKTPQAEIINKEKIYDSKSQIIIKKNDKEKK